MAGDGPRLVDQNGFHLPLHHCLPCAPPPPLYSRSIIQRLAADLGIDDRTLQRALVFYRTYDKPPTGSPLTWSHFRELLRLRDPAERAWYQRLARERPLTVKQLSDAITSDRYAQRDDPTSAKPSTSSKRPAPKLPRPKNARFTFKATVEHVVDGDTLQLLLDLGFETFRLQRIRLAGIDAPPLDTAPGAQARQYVLDRLAQTDFVLVKTNRIDIYGRYVGHLFYALKPMPSDKVFEKGNYLNQELLDRGLAEPM